MDTLLQSYMEETEDLLQKAEECIIRLEMEYSSPEINELFRIAHTIKGSSHMVGYEDIGNLMHRIEDMLDCVRNDAILFDQQVVTLCFEVLDIVKKLLAQKAEPDSEKVIEDLKKDALDICERIRKLLVEPIKEKSKTGMEERELGLVSTLLQKEQTGKYKYYLTFIIEEDAPMVSPVIVLILNHMDAIGSVVYSSVTDEYFNQVVSDNETRSFEAILCTDVEEVVLYTYFSLFYVEKINIINLTRSIHEKNDYCFNETEDVSYLEILKVIMYLCHLIHQQPNYSGKIEIAKEITRLKEIKAEVRQALHNIRNENRIHEYISDFEDLLQLMIGNIKGKMKDDKKTWLRSREKLSSLMEKLYKEIRGKYIVRIIKLNEADVVNQLKIFIDMLNKSTTLILLIDISNLDLLSADEMKYLLEIKEKLEEQDIEVGIVAERPGSRKIMNIFDSIRSVYDVSLFESEVEAMMGLFSTQESYHRILKSV